jgi:acyl-coenzyme A thioesterase PaaI-like protein
VVPTLSITTNFFKPTPSARVIGRGEVMRIGKTSVHLQGWLRDETGVLLACATATATVRAHPRHMRVRLGA